MEQEEKRADLERERETLHKLTQQINSTEQALNRVSWHLNCVLSS